MSLLADIKCPQSFKKSSVVLAFSAERAYANSGAVWNFGGLLICFRMLSENPGFICDSSYMDMEL